MAVRVVLQGFRASDRSLGRRGWAALVTAVLLLAFGCFWVVIGIFSAVLPEQRGDVTIGVFLVLLGGGLPALLAGGLLVLRARIERRRRGFEGLAVAVRAGASTLGPDEAAELLGVDRPSAERFLLDAFSRGVLVEDEEPALRPDPAWPRAEGSGAQAESAASAGTLPASQPGRPSAASLVGTLLNGTYEILSLLGEGGMGEVYVARHGRTGRRYAVKTLLPGSRLSDEALRRFKREAAAASALGHPGIVAVHDFDATPDGIHYLVCELLEGETLEARLGRVGALPWSQAAGYALQVAAALDAAHGARVLHRDLKPSNLFLCPGPSAEERVVLLDFGLARPLDDGASTKITTTGQVLGTPLYMSPEQARCEPLDQRSDVYGLAAVLYEMVTGAPPFVEATVAALYSRLLGDLPRPPSETAPGSLPPEVDDLLLTALAKAPGDRFASVTAFAAAIRTIEEKQVASSGVRLGRAARG